MTLATTEESGIGTITDWHDGGGWYGKEEFIGLAIEWDEDGLVT